MTRDKSTPRTDKFAFESLRGPAQTARHKRNSEWIVFARQLERECRAWEERFNAECAKHDQTTFRAMQAERLARRVKDKTVA